MYRKYVHPNASLRINSFSSSHFTSGKFRPSPSLSSCPTPQAPVPVGTSMMPGRKHCSMLTMSRRGGMPIASGPMCTGWSARMTVSEWVGGKGWRVRNEWIEVGSSRWMELEVELELVV